MGGREKNKLEEYQKKKNSGVEEKNFETRGRRNIMRIIWRTRRKVIRRREARKQ
jgi:hypothetical protein